MSIRITGRILAAVAVSGAALLAAASPGHAATRTAAARATAISTTGQAAAAYPQASGVLFDPVCQSFFIGDPPNLIRVNGRLTVSGTSEYPDCIGSAAKKALTTRQGEVCLQVLEGTARRGTWRNVKCSTRTFPTRAFGTYTLTAGRACPAHRQVHQYRMWHWIYIQRGPLTNKASGVGLRRFIDC